MSDFVKIAYLGELDTKALHLSLASVVYYGVINLNHSHGEIAVILEGMRRLYEEAQDVEQQESKAVQQNSKEDS